MFRFPWGDMHSLNLGWFLQKFNELREDWATAEENITGALDAEIQRAEDALSDVFDARDAAAASATAAAGSATAAGTSATAAQNSATAAAGSATLANNKATAAGLSEAAAAQSATQAGSSATAAAGSATQAGQSATNAAASETAAGNSATAAAGSATAAGNSATAAAGSASAAAGSASAAAQAASLIDMDATQSDVGKAIIVKTVADGKVSEYEFGEAGGGGGGENWQIVTLSLSNWDDTLGMIVFDAGANNKITEIKFAGQIGYENGAADIEGRFGFGNTPDTLRDKYGVYAKGSFGSTAMKRYGFIGSAYKIENTDKSRWCYIGEVFSGFNNTYTTSYNVDLINQTPVPRTPTNLYSNFNSPRYVRFWFTTKPDWAEIYLSYKL